jgi:hypothetical protein
MADEVFRKNAETNTGTPVPPAGADNHIPTNGSAANWGSITSESFLAGPKPGQEQVLIKIGDQTAMVSEGQRLEEIQKKLSFRVRNGDPEDELQFDQNRKTTVTLSDTTKIGEDQNVIVSRDQKMAVTRDQTLIVTNDQKVSVTNKRNIDAREIVEYGKEKITIQAGVELVIQGPGGSIKIDSQGVTIQGVLVKIN